jgi:putative two-component system response regulator
MTDQKQIVLIVDDQPENLVVLGDLLESHCRVRVANSGQRALSVAASDPQPDLILLDVMMPEMDGYAVLEKLRANRITCDIPVIFVTARDAIEDEEHGLELGAADYIVKPIKPLSVLARVRTQLENKRARDWLRDQNKFLEAEIVRRMHDNEIIQNASLASLAILAETRDADTGNHIYRTQGYVEVLCRALLANPDYVDQLRDDHATRIVKAAPLHDIGKVGIPDHILNKPDRLTDEEFAVMRGHSRIGCDAVATAMRRVQEADQSALRSDSSALAFLDIARQIALWHHEKWDGSGYPDGLAGEDIPLPARIMAVADVYDALISRRVYKEAFSLERACEIILEGGGSHFDPQIVAAFAEVRAQFAEIAARLADA